MRRGLLFLLLITSITSAQWQLRNNGLPASIILAISAYDRNNAAVASNGIYITTDAGNSWNKIFSKPVIDVSMLNSTTVYAVMEQKIVRTTNRGATWDTLYTRTASSGIFNYIKVFQNSIVAMADCNSAVPGSKAEFYMSTDTGATWTQKNQNYLADTWSGDVWRRVDFGSENTGLFYYSVNGSAIHDIMRTSDGGVTWTGISVFPNSYIINVKMYDKDFGIAQGATSERGYNFVTKDGGLTWQAYQGNVVWSQSIAFVKSHPAEVFMASNNELFYSADSGKVWSKQNLNISPAHARIEDIVFVDENCGWFGTMTGEVYWTENKGNAIVSAEKKNKMPKLYSLEQNYPNPFNPSTNIKFSLPEASRVTLKVFDILGREIKTLAETDMSAGVHSITWNGDNNLGQKVSTGIYLYSIVTNKFTQTRKMILMK